MTVKPYTAEVLARKDKLRREGDFIFFEEVVVGSNGIERAYGYAGRSGAKYLLNVDYVVKKLEELKRL